jgi:hypothetical protein
MAGYLQWLAGRFEALRDELPALVMRFRADILAAGQHARTPDAIANLAAGWHYWLRFAHDAGALKREEVEAAWSRAWTALATVAGEQATYHGDEEPAARFVALIRSAIASGAAHVAAPDGTAPADPALWGWQHRIVGAGLSERSEWQARGSCIGWLSGDDLYLDPAASYAVAQRLGTAGAGGLTVQARTLHKRLHHAGYLRTVDATRGRLTVRLSPRGAEGDDEPTRRDRRLDVLHFAAASLLCGKPSQPSRSSHEGEKPAPPWEDLSGKAWDGFADGGTKTSHAEQKRPTFSDGKYAENTRDSAGAGTNGTVGTVFQRGEGEREDEGADTADVEYY